MANCFYRQKDGGCGCSNWCMHQDFYEEKIGGKYPCMAKDGQTWDSGDSNRTCGCCGTETYSDGYCQGCGNTNA
jgi:hypothetical protein